MSQYLVSQENPTGQKLEEILKDLRAEVLGRCNKISTDFRPEAEHVLRNNIQVLDLLSQAIALAEDSTFTLRKSFGPHQNGKPRIGE